MIRQIIGASVRAILVALLVAMPSVILPDTSSDSAQIVALIALVAGLLTFAEYFSEYPTFIEFRDSAPFNRIRFLALFFSVVFSSMLIGQALTPGAPDLMIGKLAAAVGALLDFPFSPNRLMLIALAEYQSTYSTFLVRQLTGITALISISAFALFAFHVRFVFWPIRKKPFNFWINLPLFDPTTGGDVLYRLKRDANINLALAFLVPFVVPAVLKTWLIYVGPAIISMPQAMVWIISGWALLPLSLAMRGIALFRVAGLIEEKRRRAYAQTEAVQIA